MKKAKEHEVDLASDAGSDVPAGQGHRAQALYHGMLPLTAHHAWSQGDQQAEVDATVPNSSLKSADGPIAKATAHLTGKEGERGQDTGVIET